MTYPFSKMQSIGNDFVMVQEAFFPADADWNMLAIRFCDRHFGIGADGLIVIGKSEFADLRMRMFNPDGTEDMCGNGLRCLVHYSRIRRLIGEDAKIETLSGIRSVVHFDEVGDGGGHLVTTEMGVPRLSPDELPMRPCPDCPLAGPVLNFPLPVGDEIVPVSVVSLGTTHTILFVKTLPDDARFFAVSPQIENHPFFPERTSVMWAMMEAPNRLRLRIWERGAGETLGCGTGAGATVVAARLRDLLAPGETFVRSRGGELSVSWQGGLTPLFLNGVAQLVYEGEIGLNGSR